MFLTGIWPSPKTAFEWTPLYLSPINHENQVVRNLCEIFALSWLKWVFISYFVNATEHQTLFPNRLITYRKEVIFLHSTSFISGSTKVPTRPSLSLLNATVPLTLNLLLNEIWFISTPMKRKSIQSWGNFDDRTQSWGVKHWVSFSTLCQTLLFTVTDPRGTDFNQEVHLTECTSTSERIESPSCINHDPNAFWSW